MGLLAAHLNDAEILVVNDEKILYREPGFALLDIYILLSSLSVKHRFKADRNMFYVFGIVVS